MKKARGVLIRKTMAKVLKKKLVMLGIMVPFLTNVISSYKANAQDQNCKIIEYSYYVKINGKIRKVRAYKCVPIQTTSSNNSNLYKQKKKQEFKPPELPYCRIKRADWEGVVIDYWDKWGEKHTYRWGVNNPYWYGGTGASVELVYEYREQDDGTRNYEGLEECLIRAGKKVLTDSYYGGEGPLYIDEIDGYPFDKVVLYYTTRYFFIGRPEWER